MKRARPIGADGHAKDTAAGSASPTRDRTGRSPERMAIS